MHFIRFTCGQSDTEHKGILENNTVQLVYGSFLQNYSVAEDIFSISDISILPPVLPKNIICVPFSGIQAYVKAPSSIAGTRSEITLPENTERVSCMPRVAYVVKNKDHNKDCGVTIFGATLMLDFISDGISAARRSFTTIGPYIDTDFRSERVVRFMKNGILEHAGAYFFTPDVFSSAEGIVFDAGDIIAAGVHPGVECRRGDAVSFSTGGLRLEARIV